MNAITSVPSKSKGISRRRMIVSSALVGGAFVLGVTVRSKAGEPGAGPEINPFVVIAPDDTITLRVTPTDCGNGILTQCCMNIAEELNCDWSKIKWEMASFNRDLREKGTFSGKMSFLSFGAGRSTMEVRMVPLLQAGASARERLKAAAAAQWKVPVTDVQAEDSVLTHAPTGRKLTYGQVAAAAAKIKLAKEPEPKPREQWRLLGKFSPRKLNVPPMVNGTAVYGMDVRLPNMVYAALQQAPVFGGKIKSYNFDAIRHMPGVKAVVVVDPTEPRQFYPETAAIFPKGFADAQWGIAVIADHYWQARKALDALPIEWDHGEGAQWSTDNIVKAAFAECEKDDGTVQINTGNALEEIGKQPKIVEASYYTPYCEHSTMEPLNGTALVTPDRVDCWIPTQMASIASFTIASETGMKPENIYVHPTYMGGAFGRRGGCDDVRMITAVARKYPNVPVHVIWSREETMRQGRYRSIVAAKFKAGLDQSGMPVAMLGTYTSKGARPNDDTGPYTVGGIPNVHFVSHNAPDHILVGPYRGPNYNSHSFMMETFIDECAHAAGIDPVAYRLKLMANYPDPGWVKCLNEVASKSGWGQPLPKGKGRGVAITNWGNYTGKAAPLGTTVACVALVNVSPKGELTVEQLDMAFDCGTMVNPDGAQAQMEGGAIFGLNMSINEELTIKDGRVVQGNFNEYPILRIGSIPKINVHFGGLTNHVRMTEMGEPPVGPVGPSIGNAIFAATGKRVRAMPFRKADLSWA